MPFSFWSLSDLYRLKRLVNTPSRVLAESVPLRTGVSTKTFPFDNRESWSNTTETKKQSENAPSSILNKKTSATSRADNNPFYQQPSQ
jgi:hypothetical protein